MFTFCTQLRNVVLRRSTRIEVLTVQCVRRLSRTRPLPKIQPKKPQDVDAYKESIFERARLRRQLQKQEETAEAIAMEEEEIKEENEVTESESEDSETFQIESEEHPIHEKELFKELLNLSDTFTTKKSRHYVAFIPSEDDDEYRPPAEENYVAKIFREMEESNEKVRKESISLYPEEEVVVKLVHFDEDEIKLPVLLKLQAVEPEPPKPVLYLRHVRDVRSTKTKLFERTQTQHIEILKHVQVLEWVEMKTLSSVQEILDIHMKSNKEFAITLFRQLKRDSRIAWIHLQWIMDILPSSLELKDVAKENPEILLIKNSNPLKLGMACAGSLYPCLADFQRSFKAGLCEIELFQDVLRLGHALTRVLQCLNEFEPTNLDRLQEQLEKANAVVPNCAKVVESMSAHVTPDAVALVLKYPERTVSRIAVCKKKIYNWSDFNMYAYSEFTLMEDSVKFERFCEMYNMTRQLQIDFAVTEADDEQGHIPDFLYFWKQNWMHNEQHSGRKHPNGILPHQFVSIYEAFEGLELEGLTWAAFLQGLSILSVQKEIGVYEEVHFYERLRQSRQRKTPSIILRNGVADVMRMMCFRGQIKMDNEPKTTESPLFVLEPIAHENEIFA